MYPNYHFLITLSLFFLSFASGAPKISELPSELLREITKYLNSTDALALRECSKSLHNQISLGYHDPFPDKFSILRQAVKRIHPEASKILHLQYDDLLKHKKINNGFGFSDVIQLASVHGNLDVIKAICNISPCKYLLNDVLRIAAARGHVEVVRFLMSRLDLEVGWWPFEDNSYHVHVNEVIKLILSDPKSDPGKNENEAILMACFNGNTELVAILLNDSRVDPSDRSNSPIMMSAFRNSTEIFKLLLKDPRVNPNEHNLIAMAALAGKLEIAALLLNDSRVDPTAQDNAAVVLAAKNNQVEVLKLLLSDPRVDPGAKENIALETAARFGYYGIVEALLEDGRLDPSKNDYKAFQMALEFNHVECFRLLYNESRATPSDLNPYFSSACKSADPSIALILINDSRIDNCWNDCEAVFHTCSWGSFKVFEKLMDDPKVRENLNYEDAILSVLFFTTRPPKETLQFVKLLLAQPNFDPKAIEDNLVKYALINGKYEVVKMILEEPRINPSPILLELKRSKQAFYGQAIMRLIESFLPSNKSMH